MSGEMDRATLRADLKDSLHNAAEALADPGDFDRYLDAAALDLPRRRPLTRTASITLKADQAEYTPVPDDLIRPTFTRWANGARLSRPPWVADHPPPRPRVTLVNDGTTWKLHVSPVPCAADLAKHGEKLQYDYSARYTISDTSTETTVRPEDRWLLLLRAQAECMKELAMKNMDRPVEIGDGRGSQVQNSTPAAMRAALMKEFMAA